MKSPPEHPKAEQESPLTQNTGGGKLLHARQAIVPIVSLFMTSIYSVKSPHYLCFCFKTKASLHAELPTHHD